MSTKTLSSIYKEKITEMPDTISDMKEVTNYHKEALKYAIDELKDKAKGKKVVVEKDDNGEEKVKKPPTEYQVFVREYQKVINEKFPDLPSNQRFGKIAEEWKKHKDEKAGVDENAPTDVIVNNYMKVEEVSPPSSDNEEESKEKSKSNHEKKDNDLPKSRSEEPDNEATEYPKASSSKKKKNSLPPIKMSAK